ncbi:MAG: acylneuraminate cytidylyltransferase family protein [Chthonomonas sp.]|nr:acylneuraminate cytidylyltransferase family protein [Chthonomonas sp.]
MKILGFIPARAGSKGVPGKNHRLLSGMSLVERTFRIACESGVCDRIIVSTDDIAVMALARKIGLDVPFVRPAELSLDTTPMLDVLRHGVGVLELAGYRPDAIMLLQPTSPLRTAEQLREATSMLESGDSVCSVAEVPPTLSPYSVMRIEGGWLKNFLDEGQKITRRQDAPAAFVREGTVYLVRRDVLMEQGSIYGQRCVPMLVTGSISIDTEEDWTEAERRLAA